MEKSQNGKKPERSSSSNEFVIKINPRMLGAVAAGAFFAIAGTVYAVQKNNFENRETPKSPEYIAQEIAEDYRENDVLPEGFDVIELTIEEGEGPITATEKWNNDRTQKIIDEGGVYSAEQMNQDAASILVTGEAAQDALGESIQPGATMDVGVGEINGTETVFVLEVTENGELSTQ